MTLPIPLLMIALSATNQAPDAGPTAAVAPFVADEVAVVARIDLAKWAGPATPRRILGKLADDPDLADLLGSFEGRVDALKKAGARDLFILLDLTDMPGMPAGRGADDRRGRRPGDRRGGYSGPAGREPARPLAGRRDDPGRRGRGGPGRAGPGPRIETRGPPRAGRRPGRGGRSPDPPGDPPEPGAAAGVRGGDAGPAPGDRRGADHGPDPGDDLGLGRPEDRARAGVPGSRPSQGRRRRPDPREDRAGCPRSPGQGKPIEPGDRRPRRLHRPAQARGDRRPGHARGRRREGGRPGRRAGPPVPGGWPPLAVREQSEADRPGDA